MTVEKPTLSELEARIGRDVDHYGGKLPDNVALAWSGYVAALLEWGLITIGEHHKLSKHLFVENNPVTMILQGR